VFIKKDNNPVSSREEILKTVFGICQRGVVQNRNEDYICFAYRNTSLPQFDMRILRDFNINAVAQGNNLIVSI